MRLGTQLAIGGALLLAVGGGAVTYHQHRIDGEAAAAVRPGPSAVPLIIMLSVPMKDLERALSARAAPPAE